eukprot:5124858-Amphidinium_carterae.1
MPGHFDNRKFAGRTVPATKISKRPLQRKILAPHTPQVAEAGQAAKTTLCFQSWTMASVALIHVLGCGQT